jgi:hypothetical protein
VNKFELIILSDINALHRQNWITCAEEPP